MNTQPSIMPVKGYPLKAHLLCLCPALLMIAALLAVFRSDAAASLYFQVFSLKRPLLTAWLEGYTDWANAALYGLYGYFLIIGRLKKKPEIFYFALACLLAHLFIVVGVNPLVKAAVGRPRPWEPGPLSHFAFDELHVSFPSGHTTAMTGLVVPLAMRFTRRAAGALALGLFISAMGLTRVYLNMHYPTDLLGGLLMGSILSFIAWRLYLFFQKRDHTPI